jgi:hypothetical protein
VLTPVAPIGMRDRDAGTVGFTTSLGFGRKLDRIKANPRVALAYHAREHGFAAEPGFVLVQGTAEYDIQPDPRTLTERVRPASERFLGSPRTGLFWDRWLRAYYSDRVLVTVRVERVLHWPQEAGARAPTVAGSQPPPGDPAAQAPPGKGTAPRVDVARTARRVRNLPHLLLAYVGADGFPLAAPVSVTGDGAEGLSLAGALPAGGRRAGLLAHRFQPQLIGLEIRQYTGWLQDGTYAPHTERSIRAPSNKTLLLLANGFLARRGLRQARALGRG